LKASFKRMVETKFMEKGLWIQELKEPTEHQQRKFDSDFENRLYRDLMRMAG
jgi:hypothetical protein